MIDPAAARDAMTASDAAVGHGVCVAARRRRHTVLSVTAGLVFVGLLAAWLTTAGRVSAGVSWLIVAALLTVAVGTAVGVWLNQRPCGCVGDTDPFLAWLGAAPAARSWPGAFRQVAVGVWLTVRITVREALGRDDRDLRERMARVWLGPESGRARNGDWYGAAPTQTTTTVDAGRDSDH